MTDWRPQIRKVEVGERGLLQYANALLKQQRHEEAAEAAEEFVRDNPRSGPGLTTLGLCYIAQKRFRAAVEVLERAVGAEPLLAQPAAALGYAHFLARDYDQAEHAFREALNLDPGLPSAAIGLSQVFQKRGEPEKAYEILSGVVDRHPQLKPARLLLAFLQRGLGRRKEATAEVENILRPTPGQDGVVALFPMLFTYQSEEAKFDEATRLLEAAARFKPDNAAVRSWLGQVRLQSDQFVEAEEEFRRALTLNASLAAAKFGLAEALLRQERYDEAFAVLNSVPKSAKLMPLLQAAYGDFYLRRGVFDEAVRCYCSALLQTPNGKETLAILDQENGDAGIGHAVASQYQAAALRALQKARHVRKEEEWTLLARRVAHAGWKSVKAGREGGGSAWGTVR